MKLLLVLVLCGLAAAAPRTEHRDPFRYPEVRNETDRNILINILVRQLIAYLRNIINNGSIIFGIPPLDPLELDHFHLNVPLGLINLELELWDAFMSGFGGFVVDKSDLNLRELTFDLDINFPRLDIRAGEYDLQGDLYNAIPLYGKGPVTFVIEGFRFTAKLFLKQSEDGNSVLIDRVENTSYEIPYFKSELKGVIGGGDIDAIVNAITEEVIIGYANRFHGAISNIVGALFPVVANPILEQLDTWRFIAPLIPRN